MRKHKRKNRKKKKQNKNLERMIHIIILIIIYILFCFIEVQITGMTTYEEVSQTKTWDFDNSGDYTYDDSLIIIEDGDVTLVSTTDTTEWTTSTATDYLITSAIYESHDWTSKIQEVDGQQINVDKSKLFNIMFDNQINNGDIISIYIKSGSECEIYLCDYDTFCDSPGYGLVDYDGEQGWYNITVSGLSSPTNSFNLDPTKVKIDYIKATNIEIEEHSSTETTYPASASIETEDLSPDDLGRWNDFSKDDTLNSQTIDYQYSTDSGSSWTDVPEDNDLSSIDSESIRFKAILGSDETATPTLSSMSLDYTTLTCTEDWTCSDWSDCEDSEQTRTCTDGNECGTTDSKPLLTQSCEMPCTEDWACGDWSDCDESSQSRTCTDANDCGTTENRPDLTQTCEMPCTEDWLAFYGDCLINNKKLKHYIETNECGTLNNLPSDNATYINCDHCTPNWQEINRSCQPDDTITTYFNDINNCYTQTNLASDKTQPNRNIYSCDYCSINDCSDSHKTIFSKKEDEILQVDFKNITNTYLEINKSDSVTNAEVSVIEYKRNIKNKTISKTPLNRYLEIESNITNIESVKIIVYYNDAEINNQNLIESSLKIHYYNETSEEWEELDSIVNTTGNYVYTIVDHLSHYGVFGQQKSSSSSNESPSNGSSNGGSGSSGGGGGGSTSSWSTKTRKKQETIANKTIDKTNDKEIKTDETIYSCDPQINLPKKISFIYNDLYQGEVTSKDNCEIEEIDLELSSNLESILDYSILYDETDKKAKIKLIQKPKQDNWINIITGEMTIKKQSLKSTYGYLNIIGSYEEKTVFKEQISIEIEELETVNRFIMRDLILWSPTIFIIILSILVVVFFAKDKKKELKKLK